MHAWLAEEKQKRKRILRMKMPKTERERNKKFFPLFVGLLMDFTTAYLLEVKCVKVKVLPVIKPTVTSQKLKPNN